MPTGPTYSAPNSPGPASLACRTRNPICFRLRSAFGRGNGLPTQSQRHSANCTYLHSPLARFLATKRVRERGGPWLWGSLKIMGTIVCLWCARGLSKVGGGLDGRISSRPFLPWNSWQLKRRLVCVGRFDHNIAVESRNS